MRFWPAERYASDWMYAKVRITRSLPEVPKGTSGVIVAWRNGWPVVLFSTKVNSDPIDVVDLTKDREAVWVPCRLDDLERLELKSHAEVCC
jgi:hypothetical protein